MGQKQMCFLVISVYVLFIVFCTIGIGIKLGYGKKTKKTKPVEATQVTIKELDQDCYCRKVTPLAETPVQNRSTCSQYATDRGPGQKVISYSFYGDLQSAYFNGIAENLALIQLLYPDYIMRIYMDKNSIQTDDEYQDLCDLYCNEPNLDLCDVGEIEQYPGLEKKFGMVWRFAPMADPLVAEWHCRDLDSRPSQRELAAVQDWQQSQKTFHIMRDNKYHGASIVGCCFGMKIEITRNFPQMKKMFEAMLDYVKLKWFKGLDQNALHAVVWPEAQKDMVAHDSYLCHHFASDFNRPWPTQRISGPDFSAPEVLNFVGSNGGKITLAIHGECPKQCRPKNHPDWLLC